MAQSKGFYFIEKEVTVGAFTDAPDIKFGFQATHVIITNDTKNTLFFSFLKPDLDGILYEKDGPLALDGLAEGRMWLRAEAGKPTKVRIWAWARG